MHRIGIKLVTLLLLITSFQLAYVCVQIDVNAMNFIGFDGSIALNREGKGHHPCLLCQFALQAVDHMCVAFDTQVQCYYSGALYGGKQRILLVHLHKLL